METEYAIKDAEIIIVDNYFLNISKKYINHKEEIVRLFKKYKKNYKYKQKEKISTEQLERYWNKEFFDQE